MIFFKQLFKQDHTETKGEVLYFRLFEAIIMYQIIYFAWRWAFYILQLSGVVQPVGIANYVDISFMFNPAYALTNAALITIFVLLGFFYKGRYGYLCALIAMHIQYVARFSQGKVGHGSYFTAMALLALAISAICIEDRSERRKIVMGLFIFFVGVGYTSAAFCKLIATGFSWVDGNHLFLWIRELSTDKFSQNGLFKINFFQRFILQHYGVATAILTIGMLTEFFGFLLWFRKSRWIEATLLIAMHVGIALSMRIEFRSYVIIQLLIGYPWGLLFDHILAGITSTRLERYLEYERSA